MRVRLTGLGRNGMPGTVSGNPVGEVHVVVYKLDWSKIVERAVVLRKGVSEGGQVSLRGWVKRSLGLWNEDERLVFTAKVVENPGTHAGGNFDLRTAGYLEEGKHKKL
ncbi:hypothetical protein AMECASPLE_029356 [Ameca splendens]|uniref:Uncharacterized protein n=1 Tax=Ameca splendens TaxID=208324 RepID=A0ABV1ACL7_9TELE